MEGKSLIYAPNWVKAISIVVLVVTLGSALVMAIYYVGEENRQNWILLSLSLAQIAASGLVLGLVVFFSERDVNVRGLQKRCEIFLSRTLPETLLLVDHPPEQFSRFNFGKPHHSHRKRLLRKTNTNIELALSSGNIQAFYRIEALGEILHMLVKVNVWEVVVSYYFPAESPEDMDAISRSMQWAFDGFTVLESFTMSQNLDQQAFDATGRKYAAFHFKRDYEKEFLEDGRSQTYFAQLVTALTRSLIREAKNKSISLQHPSPSN